jgi:hypothetical protein
VDERRRSLPHQDIRERIGPAWIFVEAVGESVIHTEQPPAEPPPRENAQIAFYGDGRQVREDFAIALRAMGIEAPADLTPPNPNSNREEN